MNADNKIFAVIDTNVLVSAVLSKSGNSNPARIIEAVISGKIIPVYNQEIIDEYREVLSRPKFKFDPILINRFLSVFFEFGIKSERKKCRTEEFSDSDDIVFYEVAMNVDSSYLVTGNLKHFPNHSFIVNPAQMIEILIQKGLI